MNRFIFIFIFMLLNFSLYSTETINKTELKFIESGLIDISTLDKSIKVELVNSNKKRNYFRQNFYDGLDKCYLQKEIAIKLVKAQSNLKALNKKYSLKIYDGARPRSVSWQMYNQLKNTPMKKFVANPKTGSMHNYGAAIDITIIDSNDKELDMGDNPFNKNYIQLGFMMLRRKLGFKTNKKQLKNRELLKQVMTKADFKPLSFEWWHFNGFEKKIIREKYTIIE